MAKMATSFDSLSERAKTWLTFFACHTPERAATLIDAKRIAAGSRPGLTRVVFDEIQQWATQSVEIPPLAEHRPVRVSKIVGHWHCGDDQHLHIVEQDAIACMKATLGDRSTTNAANS
jgi:hypothetical protein